MADNRNPIGPTRDRVGAQEWNDFHIGDDAVDREIGEGDDFADSALDADHEDINNVQHKLTYAEGARHDGRTFGNGYRIEDGSPLVCRGGQTNGYKMVIQGLQLISSAGVAPVLYTNNNPAGRGFILVGCMTSQTDAGARVIFAFREGSRTFFSTHYRGAGAGNIIQDGFADEYLHSLVVGKQGLAMVSAVVNGSPVLKRSQIIMPAEATGTEIIAVQDGNRGTADGTADGGDIGAGNEEDFITDWTAGSEDFKRAEADLTTWLVDDDLRAGMIAQLVDEGDLEDVAGTPSADFVLQGVGGDKLLLGPEQVAPVVAGDVPPFARPAQGPFSNPVMGAA